MCPQVAERIKAKFGALNDVELRAAVESMFAWVDQDGSGMIDVNELDKVVQTCGVALWMVTRVNLCDIVFNFI